MADAEYADMITAAIENVANMVEFTDDTLRSLKTTVYDGYESLGAEIGRVVESLSTIHGTMVDTENQIRNVSDHLNDMYGRAGATNDEISAVADAISELHGGVDKLTEVTMRAAQTPRVMELLKELDALLDSKYTGLAPVKGVNDKTIDQFLVEGNRDQPRIDMIYDALAPNWLSWEDDMAETTRAMYPHVKQWFRSEAAIQVVRLAGPRAAQKRKDEAVVRLIAKRFKPAGRKAKDLSDDEEEFTR
jgi:hypothetical protein